MPAQAGREKETKGERAGMPARRTTKEKGSRNACTETEQSTRDQKTGRKEGKRKPRDGKEK